jgi:hypothetical protein
VKDEELDRLRTALLHAYDPPASFTQRLAKAVKSQIAVKKKTVNDKKVDKDRKAKNVA